MQPTTAKSYKSSNVVETVDHCKDDTTDNIYETIDNVLDDATLFDNGYDLQPSSNLQSFYLEQQGNQNQSNVKLKTTNDDDDDTGDDWKFKTRNITKKQQQQPTVDSFVSYQMAARSSPASSSDHCYEEIGSGFVASKLKFFQSKSVANESASNSLQPNKENLKLTKQNETRCLNDRKQLVSNTIVKKQATNLSGINNSNTSDNGFNGKGVKTNLLAEQNCNALTSSLPPINQNIISVKTASNESLSLQAKSNELQIEENKSFNQTKNSATIIKQQRQTSQDFECNGPTSLSIDNRKNYNQRPELDFLSALNSAKKELEIVKRTISQQNLHNNSSVLDHNQQRKQINSSNNFEQSNSDFETRNNEERQKSHTKTTTTTATTHSTNKTSDAQLLLKRATSAADLRSTAASLTSHLQSEQQINNKTQTNIANFGTNKQTKADTVEILYWDSGAQVAGAPIQGYRQQIGVPNVLVDKHQFINHAHFSHQPRASSVVSAHAKRPLQISRSPSTINQRYAVNQGSTNLYRTTSFADLNQQTNDLIAQTVRPLKEAASICRSSSALSSIGGQYPTAYCNGQQVDANNAFANYNYASSVRSSTSSTLSPRFHQHQTERAVLSAENGLARAAQRNRNVVTNSRGPTDSTDDDNSSSPIDDDNSSKGGTLQNGSPENVATDNSTNVSTNVSPINKPVVKTTQQVNNKQPPSIPIRRSHTSRSMSRNSDIKSTIDDHAHSDRHQQLFQSQPQVQKQRHGRQQTRRAFTGSYSQTNTLRHASSEFDLNYMPQANFNHIHSTQQYIAPSFTGYNSSGPSSAIGLQKAMFWQANTSIPVCQKPDLSLLNSATVNLSHELVQHVVDELQAISRYATRLHHRLQTANRDHVPLKNTLARGMQNSIDILSVVPPRVQNLHNYSNSVLNSQQTGTQTMMNGDSNRARYIRRHPGGQSVIEQPINRTIKHLSSNNNLISNNSNHILSDSGSVDAGSVLSNRSTSITASASASGQEDNCRYKQASPDATMSNIDSTRTSGKQNWNIDQVLEAYSDRLLKIVQDRIATTDQQATTVPAKKVVNEVNKVDEDETKLNESTKKKSSKFFIS